MASRKYEFVTSFRAAEKETNKVKHNLPNGPIAVFRHNNVGLVAPLCLRIVDFVSIEETPSSRRVAYVTSS